MCERVTESYGAGIDLRTIWNREAKRGSSTYKTESSKVADRIDQGESLGEAMAKSDGYFPDLAVAVATAGERGGRLEQAFGLLADHYQQMVRFRNQVLLSIAWPLFELGLTILIIGAMILIMGWVTQLAGGDPIDWLGFGWSTSQYFVAYVMVVVLMLGSLTILIVGTARGWFGTTPMKIARRIPLIGNIVESLALSRLAWALGIVVEAGINIKDGIRLALRATENYFYKQLEPSVANNLELGRGLTESMEETDAFPQDFIILVENAEMTGNIPEVMQKAADNYLEKVQNLFRLLSVILFFVCFIIIALIIIAAILFLFYTLIWAPQNEILEDFGYR